MALKLAIADYTFPKLEWEQALRLARDLDMEGIDIGLFYGRSHLRPEVLLSDPSGAARRVSTALRAHELELTDVFGQPAAAFEEKAVNHPDAAVRAEAAEFYWRILEFAARCNSKHLTLLPGAHFEPEDYEESLKRSAEELAWRVEAANKVGIVLGVEPHLGGIVGNPAQVKRLLDLVPGLTLALDYGHFTYQGIPDDEIEPLLSSASHFHARGACKGKLQCLLRENTIDFARILRTLEKTNYAGSVALEYVWTDWMHCDEVDNISETILLRDLLRTVPLKA